MQRQGCAESDYHRGLAVNKRAVSQKKNVDREKLQCKSGLNTLVIKQAGTL